MNKIYLGIFSFTVAIFFLLIQYIPFYIARGKCCDRIASFGYPLPFYTTGGILGSSKFSIEFLFIDLAFIYIFSLLLVFFLKENFKQIRYLGSSINPTHRVYLSLITLLAILFILSQFILHPPIPSTFPVIPISPKTPKPIRTPTITPTPTLNKQLLIHYPPETVETWRRVEYPNVWSFAHPLFWDLNDGGLIEGNISLKGPYGSGMYTISLSYPHFNVSENSQTPTLMEWVSGVIEAVPSEQRSTIETVDTTIAQSQAKILYNLPEIIYDDGKTIKYSLKLKLTHAAYIWQLGNKNPRLILIKNIGGKYDSVEMRNLFNAFIAEVN